MKRNIQDTEFETRPGDLVRLSKYYGGGWYEILPPEPQGVRNMRNVKTGKVYAQIHAQFVEHRPLTTPLGL